MATDITISDQRIYRKLHFEQKAEANDSSYYLSKPYGSEPLSWVSSFNSSAADIMQDLADKLNALKSTNPDLKDTTDDISKLRLDCINAAKARLQILKDTSTNFENDYVGVHSVMHPYALMKLVGAYEGNKENMMVDSSAHRKWYEINTSRGAADDIVSYAKNPTTTAVINWGNSDNRGRFPYSFQDFVFCKYWNKIQNNRMITLRRYPAPVNDAVEPNDYAAPDSSNNESTPLNNVFNPLATAVTYFGGDSGNKLSDILSFSVGYNWGEASGDVWNVTAEPQEGSDIMGNGGVGKFLSGSIGKISQILGILGDVSGEQKIDVVAARGLPPDPYSDGPYENRIIGPVNTISTVKKRERGLVFKQEGLTITFKYVARPIANINTKAVMLDLLANMMVMTSSDGTFFGGMHRFRIAKPAIYPWRGKDALNKMYSGKIFGPDGAFRSATKYAWNDATGAITSFLPDFISGVKKSALELVNGIKSIVSGKKEGDSNKVTSGKNDIASGAETAQETAKPVMGALERVVSARMLRGMQIPWLQGAKALLTGEPVGDWHLTIGNPLNPIAVIGNLIMREATIKFSDELGPDDFPTEMEVTVKLEHGMGRDRAAAESMFNRGYGRIYALGDKFKSSADAQTTVDAFTSLKNDNLVRENGKVVKIEGVDFNDLELGTEIATSGKPDGVTNTSINKLSQVSTFFPEFVPKLSKINMDSAYSLNNGYYIAPWTIRYTM